MANRDLDFDVKTTDVVPQNPNNVLTGIAEIGAKAAEASEQSKLLKYGAQAHADYKALDAQFRLNYADNPTDPQGLKDLQAARSDIAAKYGQNISPFYARQWQDKTTELGAQSDVSNEAWSVHQNYHNAVNNTNTGMATYINMGNQDGKVYGLTDTTDGSPIMNFLTARKTIADTATPILGNDKTTALMTNFDANYVKSYVAGAAETNPKKALELLNMPELQQHFSTQDREDMVQIIAKVQKTQQLQQELSVTKNDGQLVDIVNDPSTDHLHKIVQVQQLDMAGQISHGAADKALRVIKSSAAVDAETDTPQMSDVVNKAYDLNASSATNGPDYLRGVRNLHQQVMDLQASGNITSDDAIKLNNRINNLTSAKLSSATQSAGLEFYDANQKFNVLPPEYRADATRQLFYMGDGKDFTPLQYNNTAQTVIDKITTDRRNAAQQVIQATSHSDAEMLKKMNATPADVTETAKKHHITEAEVLRQLRNKHVSRAGRVGAINGSSGSDTTDMQSSPSITAPQSPDDGEEE